MCLILFSYKSHKKYKLILAANRDEFYERPTMPMQWWENKDGVLAGIDQDKHGTWMGANTNGKFAALTNYRKMPITEQFDSSRGFLVSEFLASDISREEYMAKLRDCSASYDGYNLLFGDIHNIAYFSNKGSETAELEPGTYGLSNHLLNTPWPKVVAGKSRLQEIIEKEDVDTNALFQMMENTDFGQDADLPDTGVGLELERLLSAAFIKSPNYGTRCSTLLLIDWNNNVTLEERSHVPKALNKFNFTIA